MEYFKQCEFKNGNLTTTAWIPEEGAKVGSSMLFKHDKKSGRWVVTAVGSARILRDNIGDSDVFESIKEKE
jgi:hypothetical protein